MARRIKHLLVVGFLVFSQLVGGFALLTQRVAAAVPGINELVSVSASGTQSNHNSRRAEASVMSGDGRFVVFESLASNLVSGDTNNHSDVFVRDTANDTTTRVSVSTAGAEGNEHSFNPSISDDGRFIIFESDANNMVVGLHPILFSRSIFIHDRQTGTTDQVPRLPNGDLSLTSTTRDPAISGNGRYVTFALAGKDARTLLGRNDISLESVQIIVRDMQTGAYKLVTKSSSNVPSDTFNFEPSISCDGNSIAFRSYATNLVANDTNGMDDIYIATDVNGQQSLKNITFGHNITSGETGFWAFDVSCDGEYVAFQSEASNLVLGDTNGVLDIFNYTISNESTARVSLQSNGQQRTTASARPSISGDGRLISYAASGIHHNDNIYSYGMLYDSLHGTTEYANINSNQEIGNQGGGHPDISNDGKYFAFVDNSSNYGPVDTNNWADVYRGETGLVTDVVPPAVTGVPDRAPDFGSWYSANVTIDWQASDPAPSSGTPTDPANTTASLEGEHTYTSGQSCDPAGNCATGNLTLKIDKTAPTAGNLTWSTNPQVEGSNTTLSADVSDQTSGVQGGEYFIGTDPGPGNGTAMTLGSGELSASFGDDLEPGTYAVGVRSRDNAGNWSAVAASELEILYNDTTPPVISHALNSTPTADGWFNSPVMLTWTVQDNESPVTNQQGCGQTTVNQNGTNTYTCTATSTGGTASDSLQVKYDATSPLLSNFDVGCMDFVLVECVMLRVSPQTRTFTVAATDALSGIKRGEFYLDTDPGQGSGTAATLNGSIFTGTVSSSTPFGNHILYVRTQDKAGNWSVPVARTFFIGIF